jgi:DNA-binding SARP family transcriptional activator
VVARAPARERAGCATVSAPGVPGATRRPRHETGNAVDDSGTHARSRPGPPAGPGALPYGRLFEGSPWGLLVTRPDGGVVGANRTARRMLGDVAGRPGARCCELLGCGAPGTPLAQGCISGLAAGLPEPLPEVRVDLPRVLGGGALNSVWVVGARLEGDGELVLLQLRPGGAGDRRRRSAPQWGTEPRLTIRCLGPTVIEGGSGSLGGSWLGHRPGRLFKYLVLRRGHVVPVDELLEALGGEDRRNTPGSIRQAVYVLRERLEPLRPRHEPSAFVGARHGGYGLQTANAWVDLDEFEAHARKGARALSVGDRTGAERHLSAAVALCRGELMSEEPYSEWVLPERDRLRGVASECRRSLSQIRLDAGDVPGATRHLLALSELEPLDLELQKELLALMLREGRHSEAERRLEIIRRRFRHTFGEEPDLDLSALRPSR